MVILNWPCISTEENRHFCVAGNVRPHVNQVSAKSAIRAVPHMKPIRIL